MPDFKPRAFVKTTCPYSFKFRLFLTEAGKADQFEFVPMDPDAPDFAALKQAISDQTGKPVHFPTVEIEPGKFMHDSDALIAHYASHFGIDAGRLPTLQFYRTGLYPTFLELFDLAAAPLAWVIRLGKRPRALR